MITYIGLLNFTDKGLQSIKDTTKRAAAAKEVAKKFGVNLRDIYWTIGDCDVVCVLEADSEQALTAFNLASASPATPNPVLFANQREGGSLSQALGDAIEAECGIRPVLSTSGGTSEPAGKCSRRSASSS